MDGNCDKTKEKKTDYRVACQSTRLVVFSICRMRLSDNASWIPRGLGSGSHWAEWQQFVTESTSTADTYRTIEICARWKLSIWLSDSNHTNAPWGERGWVTPTMSQYAVAEHIWCCFVSAEDVGRETEHCDEHVCLSVCLSVCPPAQLRNVQSSPNCVRVAHVLDSVLWRRCNMLCTSGFMDNATFARNGHE